MVTFFIALLTGLLGFFANWVHSSKSKIESAYEDGIASLSHFSDFLETYCIILERRRAQMVAGFDSQNVEKEFLQNLEHLQQQRKLDVFKHHQLKARAFLYCDQESLDFYLKEIVPLEEEASKFLWGFEDNQNATIKLCQSYKSQVMQLTLMTRKRLPRESLFWFLRVFTKFQQ